MARPVTDQLGCRRSDWVRSFSIAHRRQPTRVLSGGTARRPVAYLAAMPFLRKGSAWDVRLDGEMLINASNGGSSNPGAAIGDGLRCTSTTVSYLCLRSGWGVQGR